MFGGVLTSMAQKLQPLYQRQIFLSMYPINQTIQSFLNSMLKHPTGRKQSPMGNYNQYILLQFQGDC